MHAERQRLVEMPTSRLAIGHLMEWADGLTSAKRLRDHMFNATIDGNVDPLITRLSKVGISQNCQHGLMKLLDELGVSELITATRDTGVWTNCILPSTWCAYLSKTSPREFRLRLGADSTVLLDFWTKFFDSDARRQWADQHPHLKGKTPQQLIHTQRAQEAVAARLRQGGCDGHGGKQ